MNESSTASSSSSSSATRSPHHRRLSSSPRLAPRNINAAASNLPDEPSASARRGSTSNGGLTINTDYEVLAGPAGLASASSSSISPIAAASNRSVRRRGSSRSSSFASNAGDEGTFLQEQFSHLSPAHAAISDAASVTGFMRDENNNVQAHRRYVSADITGHGMLLHSRENSTNSPVVIYLPDNHDEIDARPRPRSTSAWSNFSLGEEYGFGDASSIDTGRNARHRYDDADEDNDAIHLTPLSPAKTGFHHTQPHTLDVDLEGTPPGLYSSSIVPSKGISRRAQGTEKYYRQSQSGTAATSGVTRRRTILENVQSTVRKMSVRVVNLAQEDSQGHVPLTDDMEDLDEQHPKGKSDTEEAKHEDVRAHLSRSTTGSSNGSLRGKSLGVFDPDNPARKAALAFFLWGWTEPLLLLLIVANVVILTIQSARDVFKHPRPASAGYFHEWEDYVIFVIFVIFTLEMLARILVSGFIFNAEESHRTRTYKDRLKRFKAKIDGKALHAPVMQRSTSSSESSLSVADPAPLDYLSTGKTNKLNDNHALGETEYEQGGRDAGESREQKSESPNYPPRRGEGSSSGKFASIKNKTSRYQDDVPFFQALNAQRAQHQKSNRKAYLRHSWNRIDFLAVTAFWLTFFLASTGLEYRHTLYIFRALAALRSARLLVITSGTATILRSLKQSAPLMVSVAFFVIFAMALFSIVGVYSFKGSFQRSCVWIDPAGEANYTFEDQRCGGHVNTSTGGMSSYIPQGSVYPASYAPKGFICPAGQLCMDLSNPYNGTQSFDNIFASLLQVVIITGANGWADLMYAMIDAEYFASCLFFIVCLVLLNFWLMNIFVAVIINTFGNIREETKHSAFAGRPHAHVLDDEADKVEKESKHFSTALKRRVSFAVKWAWIAAIIADVGIQASKTAGDSPERIKWLNKVELYFTLAFLVEIVARAMSYLPNYRKFSRRARNNADTFLAIITTFIQIPVIRNSPVYPWLTVFQLMRFYRVILAVPRMRALLAKVLSSVAGLINMVLFLLLMNLVVAIVAVQLLRGQIPEEVDGDYIQYSFYQVYNSFLAIYVVFSSENWPDILYNATAAEAVNGQAWLSALFIAGWFLFANFILLQMFIAVINEGFAIAEEEKHKAQIRAFAKQNEPPEPSVSWISRLNPYRLFKKRWHGATVDAVSANPIAPFGKATIHDYVAGPWGSKFIGYKSQTHQNNGTFISSLRRAAVRKGQSDKTLFKASTRPVRGSAGEGDEEIWDVDQRLDLLKFKERQTQLDARDDDVQRRAIQAEFMAAYPSYDRSLWIFSQRNPIRRLCQRVVEPAYGDRLDGAKPYRTWTAAFKLLILCAIAGSVTIAATATPAYRRDYYLEHGALRLTWFNLTEVSLGFIFVIEFIIKVVADGFAFTPNAYLFSVWNVLDFFVLLTLVINVGTALSPSTAATSRFTRSLKAFRALRLINLSETMRQTFYDVMIIGASLIFDASVLTVLYIIPFSIWGQNLFAGLLYSCNDGDVLGKTQCVGEYMAAPAQWDVLLPRAWQNPYVWSFDSFRSAMLILFEIVSLEGWVDVMDSAMSITGRDNQSEPNYSQYNSIFFLTYNLIGAIVVLTLFVSVIIENFSLRSGQALLTSEQQQWVDLKKLILRQRPARRPSQKPPGRFRSWCYDRAVHKHGWWSRMITALYVVHIGVLASQTETQASKIDHSRDYVFLGLTLVYLFNIVVGMAGLGAKSFWQNGWNVYDVFAVTGTFATTIPLVCQQSSQVATQLQKLFLVSICFKLVQRNNSLNQLFKTAIASLPAILNVFGLWLTLFLVWSIMFLESFSLTRWEQSETWMQNYSTFPRAMVMLAFMSVGEGWNAYMHDYTVDYPYCSPSSSYLFTDCGDAAGALVLFITWNVISMYIFANMLTGVVVENFSYVFSLYGKTTSLSREEMRKFKKVWSMFDSERTGYLKRKDFVPFLSRLSGIFDVKVYPSAFHVKHLRATCQWTGDKPLGEEYVVGDLNLSALKQAIDVLDKKEIARKRREFNRLYQEALLSEEPGKGISFTNMLVMLAQHKLIDPDKALKIEDLLLRKAKQQRVDDLVALDRVRSRLQTIFWRRAFLAHRSGGRIGETRVPAIVLNDAAAPRSPPHFGLYGEAGEALEQSPFTEPISPSIELLSDQKPADSPTPALEEIPFPLHTYSNNESGQSANRSDLVQSFIDNDWSQITRNESANARGSREP